jgi:hypothetical protein
MESSHLIEVFLLLMIWGFMIMQWEKEIRTKGRKKERKKKK